uniref:AF4/FMR2 family member 4 n=1 Tax=Xenopus tropicalis TaxID=8364 RepID=A0A6I8QKQ3_XENTR
MQPKSGTKILVLWCLLIQCMEPWSLIFPSVRKSVWLPRMSHSIRGLSSKCTGASIRLSSECSTKTCHQCYCAFKTFST